MSPSIPTQDQKQGLHRTYGDQCHDFGPHRNSSWHLLISATVYRLEVSCAGPLRLQMGFPIAPSALCRPSLEGAAVLAQAGPTTLLPVKVPIANPQIRPQDFRGFRPIRIGLAQATQGRVTLFQKLVTGTAVGHAVGARGGAECAGGTGKVLWCLLAVVGGTLCVGTWRQHREWGRVTPHHRQQARCRGAWWTGSTGMVLRCCGWVVQQR